MKATKVIRTITLEDLEIEYRVAEISTGYSVTLKDLDSGSIVPTGIIYPTAAQAINYAETQAAKS